ncbi:MAG: hypothetical protein ACYTFI_11330 [Planctomycetota bacterium]
MPDSIDAARETIRLQIEQHEAAIEKLRAADATLAELGNGAMVAVGTSAEAARPISLKDGVKKALARGAAPCSEVIRWVRDNYDSATKPNSVRGTLSYLKAQGVVNRGGKNWYLATEKTED